MFLENSVFLLSLGFLSGFHKTTILVKLARLKGALFVCFSPVFHRPN